MALIICIECGKEFSDKAPECPNCGCPTEDIIAEISDKAKVTCANNCVISSCEIEENNCDATSDNGKDNEIDNSNPYVDDVKKSLIDVCSEVKQTFEDVKRASSEALSGLIDKDKIDKSKSEKSNVISINKKFNKLVIALVVLLAAVGLCIGVVSCNNSTERIVWDELYIGHVIPQPEKTVGVIECNTNQKLEVRISDYPTKNYRRYKEKCIDIGFENLAENENGKYKAYNDDGFYLQLEEDTRLDEILIYLEAPMEMEKTDFTEYKLSIINYSNSVIEKLHLQIKQAFKEGVRRGFITDNIMEIHEIRRPKSNKPTKKVRGLTEEEQKLFTEALENYPIPKHGQHYKRQLLIELYTGMRMGEINALAPEDIDFNRSLIHVHKTVSTGLNNRSFISDTTKTDAGNRYVPINNLVKSILEESVGDMKSNPEGLIFYNHRRGSIINTSQVNSYFNRVAEKAGIDITGQHSLRHTFATRCIEAGITPVVLKTWLGHTDIHVTLDTYSDVFDRLNHKSISQFEGYMTNQYNEVFVP